MTCPICGGEINGDTDTYVNLVCDDCDDRAVNEDGGEPLYNRTHDGGENPVFIDGEKCWRRYLFEGLVTMLDEHDCDSIIEFYYAHGMM